MEREQLVARLLVSYEDRDGVDQSLPGLKDDVGSMILAVGFMHRQVEQDVALMVRNGCSFDGLTC
jgi:hypothetical protein